MVVVEPKTGRSRRIVHLAAGTVEALRRLHEEQMASYNADGESWSEARFVFSTAEGRPLDPGYVRQAFHRSLLKAGLPLIRVHDLRHTAATYLLSIGTHPKVVQELLGHSSVMLTLDTYSHVLPALHKEVAVRMNYLFEESQPR